MLKSTLEQLRLFDERTAKSYLMHARDLDHNSWDLREKVKRLIQKIQTDDSEVKALALDIVASVGSVHTSCFDNFKRMLRVYQLAGEPLTREIVNRWIADDFIPEHYRSHVLPQVHEKNLN